MALKSNHRQRGAVLALVLFMLAALSLLAVGIGKDILLDHTLSTGTRASLNAHLLLDSGQRLAAAVLVANSRRGDPDTLNEKEWGQFNAYLDAFSSQSATTDFSGSITDENSRFPLPALFQASPREEAAAKVFSQLFVRLTARIMRNHGFAAGQAEALHQAEIWLENIHQWAGLSAVPEEARRWYLSRQPALLPPGRPPLGPEELMQVRWPNMDEAFVRAVVLGTPETPGLTQCLSVWARGPINVNTALPQVLQTLSDNEEQALHFTEAIVRGRAKQDAKLEEKWYLEAARRAGMNLDNLPVGVLDVRSRWYRLEIVVAGGRTGMAIGWVTNGYVNWEYQAIR